MTRTQNYTHVIISAIKTVNAYAPGPQRDKKKGRKMYWYNYGQLFKFYFC